MREFEYTFEDGLKVGLRKHHKNPRNNQACVEYYNLKVSKDGPEPYRPIEAVYEDQGINWPFPQLLIGTKHSYLVLRDEGRQVFEVNEINADLSLTKKLEVDDQTFGAGGGTFELADFENYQLMANGVAMVQRDPTNGALVPFSASATIPRMRTLCGFRGQIVGGNVLSGWYDCDSSSVVWSRIGTSDFTPNRKNTAGYRKMPLGGTVLRVLPLGKIVIVYTDKEVGALVPAQNPAPTFGLETLLSVGIVSRGAVGGDEKSHVFVDRSGWVWRLDDQMKLEKLGYQEWMVKADPAKLVVSHEPVEGDFYLSDGTVSYMLSPYGLSQVWQAPTSLGLLNQSLVAVADDLGQDEARVTTDTIDMGFRSLKTCFVTEVASEGGGLLRTSTLWRNDRTRDFLNSGWTEINQLGVATQIISGNEFRFALRAQDYTSFSLDYLTVRWKMTDLRSMRSRPASKLYRSEPV